MTEESTRTERPMLNRRSRGVFYGWWIVFGAWAATLFNSATTFSGFGAFFLPVLREFGATRASLTWVVSAARLEGSVLGPLEGWLVDRYGPRRMMLVGMPLMGLGFVILSQAASLEVFYLVFLGCVTVGSSLGTGTPGGVAVANWFIKKRSTALGLVNTGFSVGAVLVPVITLVIESAGWRGAALWIGVAILVFGTPLGLLMRHRPEDHGYLPDGEQSSLAGGSAERWRAGRRHQPSETNLTAKQAMQTSAFWLLGLTFATRTVATVAMQVHQIPFFIDSGFSPTEAGLTVGAVGAVSFFGRVVVGWLGDRWNKQALMALNLFLLGVGVMALSRLPGNAAVVVPVYVATYGLAFGGTNPLMGAIRGDFFGRRHYGTVGGFMSLLTLLGTMGGPLLAAYSYDLTGSYTDAFIYIGGFSLLGAVMVLLARRPQVSEPATD